MGQLGIVSLKLSLVIRMRYQTALNRMFLPFDCDQSHRRLRLSGRGTKLLTACANETGEAAQTAFRCSDTPSPSKHGWR